MNRPQPQSTIRFSIGPDETGAAYGGSCPECGGTKPTCCSCPLPCVLCGHAGATVKGVCRAVIGEFGPQGERRVCGCACKFEEQPQSTVTPEAPERILIDGDDVTKALRNRVGSYYTNPSPADASNRDIGYHRDDLCSRVSEGETEEALRVLSSSDRVELQRTIAESDVADWQLDNEDIDTLVDLFEAWLERRATQSTDEGGVK